MVERCVFCQIIAERAPATVIRRWADAIAIAPLGPVTEGHTLVIPTMHVRDALENPVIAAVTMRRAAELATPPCNIITNVGREATQSVFHLHLHIVPRRDNDGLALPWYSGRRKRRSAADTEDLASGTGRVGAELVRRGCGERSREATSHG